MRRGLDRIDVNILAVLEAEGRIQNQQLAERVNLSPGACSQRLRRLEKAKLISAYRAEIDVKRVCNAVSSFAVVKLSQQGSLKQIQFLRALEEIPEVVDCYEVAGDADYIVKFDCPSLQFYHERITSLLSDPNLAVGKIESHIMLRHVSNLKRSNLGYLAASQDDAA